MSLEDLYFYFLLFWSSLAAVVFISLYFRDAPYGRFIDLNSSVSVSARTGWVVMESPTILGVIVFFIIFQESINLAEIVLSIIWLSHYLHRTLIWPFRAKLNGKQMSILVVFMASLFNVINVCLQFSWIFMLSNLIDELLTPDSSRFWDANIYEPGRSQPSFDKQYVRDWLKSSGWDKTPPGPVLPEDVVAKTHEKYTEAMVRLTGVAPRYHG